MKKIEPKEKIGFRVTPAEYKQIAKAAKKDGVSMSEYCRWRSLNASSKGV
jgi:uncharacterized protein (DUF1778 family)